MAVLREAEASDAALISRIIANSWRGAYQELIDPVYLARLPEETWLPSMRTWLDSGRMYGLIAMENELPVGCVIYGRARDEDHSNWGEIVSLYVLPETMGKGIGTQLMQAACDALMEDGYRRVYLWSIKGNARAERFYRRCGFAHTADEISYHLGGRTMSDIRLVRTEE